MNITYNVKTSTDNDKIFISCWYGEFYNLLYSIYLFHDVKMHCHQIYYLLYTIWVHECIPWKKCVTSWHILRCKQIIVEHMLMYQTNGQTGRQRGRQKDGQTYLSVAFLAHCFSSCLTSEISGVSSRLVSFLCAAYEENFHCKWWRYENHNQLFSS